MIGDLSRHHAAIPRLRLGGRPSVAAFAQGVVYIHAP